LSTVNARMIPGPHQPFERTTIERRDPGPRDVVVDLAFTGVCHSDVSHAWSEWGASHYPLVPGHEMSGIVSAVGPEVTRFAVGDRVGVGCYIGTCGECTNCRNGNEHHCSVNRIKTYGSVDVDGTITAGGYSERIVVDEGFVLRIPDSLSLESSAPLLCAGITVYSPLRKWGTRPGSRVAILGFGGLGHVAVQIAAAMGAHVTVLDLDAGKADDARALGAGDFRDPREDGALDDLRETFDILVSTVPVPLDLDAYLALLAMDGVFVNIGVVTSPWTLRSMSLIHHGRALAGTRIGSMAETQEMLDFCGEHGIGAVVEVIDADRIDEAFARLVAGDVRFRFVIDIATMADTTTGVPANPTEGSTS